MKLYGSHVIIDAAQVGSRSLRELVAGRSLLVSAISYVEVLGFHRLTAAGRVDLVTFFSAIQIFPLSTDVVEQAIRLRQIRKMGLGDALVAGTALVHRLPLVTRNIKHFEWVEGLTLVDPARPAS